MNILVKNQVFKLLILKVNSETLNIFDIKIIAKHQKQIVSLIILLLRIAVELNNKYNNSLFNNKETTVKLSNELLSKQKLLLKKQS